MLPFEVLQDQPIRDFPTYKLSTRRESKCIDHLALKIQFTERVKDADVLDMLYN